MDGAVAGDVGGLLHLDDDIALIVNEAQHTAPGALGMEVLKRVFNGRARELARANNIPITDEKHELVADNAINIEIILSGLD